MVKLKINTSSAGLLAAAVGSPMPPEKKIATPKPPSSKASNAKSTAAKASTSKNAAPKVSTPKSSTSNTSKPKITLKTKPSVPTLKIRSSSLSAAAAAPLAPKPPARNPILKLKTAKPAASRHKRRQYEPGNGYDSEASDREDDPAIEEQFILRMPPGDDCDYLRDVIEKKELNVTTDVWFKFKDSRRAVVCVRGNLYAALLVDLPCIIEANKTLDKKVIFKAADICQMLLVTERITSEEAALSKLSTRPQDITYPHGITPPMQHVRKRRFRKRISNRTIEAVETEVNRLLREDEEAVSSQFALIDAVDLAARDFGDGDGDEEGYDLLGGQEYDDGQNGDGVGVEYEYSQEGEEMDEDALANDLESALMDGLDVEGGEFGQGDMIVNVPRRAGGANDEESDDDDDDDEEEAPVFDEEAVEKAQESQRLKEEIEDLQGAIDAKVREYEAITNGMLKARIQKVINSLKAELELKIGQNGGNVGGE